MRNKTIYLTTPFESSRKDDKHINNYIKEKWGKKITLSQPIPSFKLVSYIFTKFNADGPFGDKNFYPRSPPRIETFSYESLLEKMPFNFIIALLKINFEEDIYFLPTKLMNS
jgi:hypothetical protein